MAVTFKIINNKLYNDIETVYRNKCRKLIKTNKPSNDPRAPSCSSTLQIGDRKVLPPGFSLLRFTPLILLVDKGKIVFLYGMGGKKLLYIKSTSNHSTVDNCFEND